MRWPRSGCKKCQAVYDARKGGKVDIGSTPTSAPLHDGKGPVLVIDKRLCETTPGDIKLTDYLAKQERRGYTIKVIDLDQLLGPNVRLILSESASWWTPKFWGMLDAKVKGREKEASKHA